MRRDYCIGDFVFTRIKNGCYKVFHHLWEWHERVEKGKKVIRLKAK